MKKIGEVTHFFDDIKVAVLNLKKKLKEGDTVLFERNDEELFEQEVKSMEIDHESVTKAKKGDDVAMKVKEPVKEGTEVYKK